MDAQDIQAIQQTTDELLGRLGVVARSVVEWDEAEVVIIRITPLEDGQSLGILIGYKGETLRALQLILSLMVNQGREEWLRLWVDVDDYRLHYEENLKSLARRSAEKALFLKESVVLSPMSSSDRRVIHLTVADTTHVTSESVGEGLERRVVIKPQT